MWPVSVAEESNITFCLVVVQVDDTCRSIIIIFNIINKKTGAQYSIINRMPRTTIRR